MDSLDQIAALRARHAVLEQMIVDEDKRPRPDSDRLVRLKVEKLHLKDAMEKLRATVN